MIEWLDPTTVLIRWLELDSTTHGHFLYYSAITNEKNAIKVLLDAAERFFSHFYFPFAGCNRVFAPHTQHKPKDREGNFPKTFNLT